MKYRRPPRLNSYTARPKRLAAVIDASSDQTVGIRWRGANGAEVYMEVEVPEVQMMLAERDADPDKDPEKRKRMWKIIDGIEGWYR